MTVYLLLTCTSCRFSGPAYSFKHVRRDKKSARACPRCTCTKLEKKAMPCPQ